MSEEKFTKKEWDNKKEQILQKLVDDTEVAKEQLETCLGILETNITVTTMLRDNRIPVLKN